MPSMPASGLKKPQLYYLGLPPTFLSPSLARLHLLGALLSYLLIVLITPTLLRLLHSSRRLKIFILIHFYFLCIAIRIFLFYFPTCGWKERNRKHILRTRAENERGESKSMRESALVLTSEVGVTRDKCASETRRRSSGKFRKTFARKISLDKWMRYEWHSTRRREHRLDGKFITSASKSTELN